MINETIGDIWSYVGTHKIVIPTNQIGVMGAGLALQAKEKYPGIQKAYQCYLKTEAYKNTVWCSDNYPDLVLAPTKRHWKDKSRLEDVVDILIKLSTLQGGPFALPEMGCGLGGLEWHLTEGFYKVFEKVHTKWVVVHPPAKVKMWKGILR
jgi:hypothetical protein